ncbi:MAG: hypothetical protein HY075_14370 [Deltaproteobacteria bacterium]|nr:hypothetical protein [Deltaproteobacteria bacterium]
MKALVLAAGLGTRLRPFTLDRAKPSLPVVGIPALWYGAWHIKRELAIAEIAVNMSHAPETVREAGNDGELQRSTGIRFHYSDESDRILGSSGALWKLAPWVDEKLLAVCNGDSICFPGWKKMLEFHGDRHALLTLHVRAFDGADEPFTNVEVAPDGRVLGFGAKATSGVMFSGNYLLEPELLKRLPAGVSELRPTLLEPLIKERRLYAYREDTAWFDTGNVAAYARAQFELLSKIPAARELVETKMREEKSGCWVPRDWVHGADPALQGPVVLSGGQGEWATLNCVYGPRFVGIEAPPPGVSVPFSNAVVLSTHVGKI